MTLPAYEPPSDPDAPLDPIERVLVEMWADIVEARIRAKLARGLSLGELASDDNLVNEEG